MKQTHSMTLTDHQVVMFTKYLNLVAELDPLCEDYDDQLDIIHLAFNTFMTDDDVNLLDQILEVGIRGPITSDQLVLRCAS